MVNFVFSAGGLIAVDVLLTALATLAVVVRIRTRVVKRVGVVLDDILSIISLVSRFSSDRIPTSIELNEVSQVLFYIIIFIPVIIGRSKPKTGCPWFNVDRRCCRRKPWKPHSDFACWSARTTQPGIQWSE